MKTRRDVCERAILAQAWKQSGIFFVLAGVNVARHIKTHLPRCERHTCPLGSWIDAGGRAPLLTLSSPGSWAGSAGMSCRLRRAPARRVPAPNPQEGTADVPSLAPATLLGAQGPEVKHPAPSPAAESKPLPASAAPAFGGKG